ncbi:unnamed protein product [Tilletia controversa]|nr:unnamed protein product [Tilletia controversa]CAD6914370.1 unnamed protein product [Tilletia controversa]CAD6935668.1 unnamed protein product [Tilletia controversa]
MFARLAALAILATSALASHTINFSSNCPSAVMQLPGIGNYGPGSYTFNQDVNGGIASGGQNCDINGTNCISVEFTLNGGYSTGDITLISPHAYSGPASFTMTPGGSSATCDNPNCGPNNAFYKPDDYSSQRYDSSPNAGINIDISC